MAIIKCKMCGGDLEITSGVTVAECEFCGTKQTLPRANDEVIQNLFNRANTLRLKGEFDKAELIYEKILQQNDAEAEAHWGIVLCKYGIEYVEDPETFMRIPTCHRASYDAVTTDADYLATIEHADITQRSVYEAEARAIDEIQKNILSIVEEEKPFDVFICYKETDENGNRTVDSTIANDIYHQLTMEGLNTFYAAITLEDKLGQAYEPYIFAALNSAKVMLVIGTKPQYFTAVWVKNEWSRFLKLMKTDRSKLLIPCYKDMDAYELPEEFAHLQAQDMSKIGFINDVVRGIRKVTRADAPKATAAKEPAPSTDTAGIAPLLKRAFIFLEDGDWNSANKYCEKVLDIDPENAQAYLGKLMAELQVGRQENLKERSEPFDGSGNYQKAVRFADDKLKATLTGYIEHINNSNEQARLDGIYDQAKKAMTDAYAERQYIEAAKLFRSISGHRNSDELATDCAEKAEIARKDAILSEGNIAMNKRNTGIADLEAAIKQFQQISGWKDADEKLRICQEKLEELKTQAETERLEKKYQAELDRQKSEQATKFKKKLAIIATPIICIIIVFVILMNTVIIPNSKYHDAITLIENGKYKEAVSVFEALDGYKDSASRINECRTAMLDAQYTEAVGLLEEGKYEEAVTVFEALDGHKDSANRIQECRTGILDTKYGEAVRLMEEGKYTEAVPVFIGLNGHKDSTEKLKECRTVISEKQYTDALSLMDSGHFDEAYEVFRKLGTYKDSSSKADHAKLLATKEELRDAKVGDTLLFGVYEQDNSTANGKEPIEWLVLNIQNEKALVISKYALDCKEFHTTYDRWVSWNTCSLRECLNKDFIIAAFSNVESALISTVTVPADKNPLYDIGDSEETQDQVFLLSITEAERYFGSDGDRICHATEYALSKGPNVAESILSSPWWLRSSGFDRRHTSFIGWDGSICEEGWSVDSTWFTVRPAMWIDFSE